MQNNQLLTKSQFQLKVNSSSSNFILCNTNIYWRYLRCQRDIPPCSKTWHTEQHLNLLVKNLLSHLKAFTKKIVHDDCLSCAYMILHLNAFPKIWSSTLLDPKSVMKYIRYLVCKRMWLPVIMAVHLPSWPLPYTWMPSNTTKIDKSSQHCW